MDDYPYCWAISTFQCMHDYHSMLCSWGIIWRENKRNNHPRYLISTYRTTVCCVHWDIPPRRGLPPRGHHTHVSDLQRCNLFSAASSCGRRSPPQWRRTWHTQAYPSIPKHTRTVNTQVGVPFYTRPRSLEQLFRPLYRPLKTTAADAYIQISSTLLPIKYTFPLRTRQQQRQQSCRVRYPPQIPIPVFWIARMFGFFPIQRKKDERSLALVCVEFTRAREASRQWSV